MPACRRFVLIIEMHKFQQVSQTLFSSDNVTLFFQRKQKTFNEKLETDLSYKTYLYAVEFWGRSDSHNTPFQVIFLLLCFFISIYIEKAASRKM